MSTDTSKSLFDQAMKEISAANFVTAEYLLQQASEINEESTTLYAASWAVLLALRDREDEAIAILEERLEAHSTDPNLLLAYGITLEKQGNFDDAEDAFREVLSRDADNPGALRGLSARLKDKGELMEAARLAARAFTEAPDNLILAKTAADMLEAIDQPKTAFEILDLAAHYNPEDEEIVSRALKGCLANNMLDRAKEILLILDHKQPWAAGWKASFYDWQGEGAKADDLIARTLARPGGDEPGFLFQVACIAMRRGDVDTADMHVERILEQDPQHTGALRIRADLSLGRTDLDAAIDPLQKAFALSADSLTGWRLFWSCVVQGRFEEAEETIGILAEDEDLLGDTLELTRLELAEAFLDAAQEHPLPQTSFPNLDMLPDEVTCGLVLEFLEAIEEYKNSTKTLEELYGILYDELGKRDPVLRLNRLYARSNWLMMNSALEQLLAGVEEGEPVLDMEQTTKIHEVYSLLTAIALQDGTRIETFSKSLDDEKKTVIHNILAGKNKRNPTEQRWLDRLRGEKNEPLSPTPAAAPPVATTATGVAMEPGAVGGFVNSTDVQVVYETEDGELITDLNSGDYELIEEGEEDDNEEYEYIWVEEPIEKKPSTPEDDDTYSE